MKCCLHREPRGVVKSFHRFPSPNSSPVGNTAGTILNRPFFLQSKTLALTVSIGTLGLLLNTSRLHIRTVPCNDILDWPFTYKYFSAK